MKNWFEYVSCYLIKIYEFEILFSVASTNINIKACLYDTTLYCTNNTNKFVLNKIRALTWIGNFGFGFYYLCMRIIASKRKLIADAIESIYGHIQFFDWKIKFQNPRHQTTLLDYTNLHTPGITSSIYIAKNRSGTAIKDCTWLRVIVRFKINGILVKFYLKIIKNYCIAKKEFVNHEVIMAFRLLFPEYEV